MQEENKNIIIGGKDPKDPNYYESVFGILKDKLKIMTRTWYFFGLMNPSTKETYQYKVFYFERKYVNQVAESLSKLDFDTISEIPHEKGQCAYQLELRYLKSGDVFSCQLYEARVGAGGGYYCVSPALILLNQEGKKALSTMSQKLKKLKM